MHRFEVLNVERLGCEHVPTAARQEAKGHAGHAVFREGIKEERQRKEGLASVEEEDQAVALLHGIGGLPGKVGNAVATSGDARAVSVGAVLPAMERAADRFTRD